ncbi:MAG: threonine synthase [Vallitaleaceae bacterium]|nr:threonine synthase [Vallitaleaceae bacterium]
MSYVSGFRCTICETIYKKDAITTYTCPSCGEKGILDVLYDYKSIGEVLTRDSLKANSDTSIWRYLPLLPVEDTYLSDTLKVGGTPLYKSKGLAEVLGTRHLYIKDEGLNPTASLKDRASVIAVIKALEAGISTICCSSTGNAASSLAGNAARMGLKTFIFVPERAPIGKLTQLLIYDATVVSVAGDYKATFDLSKAAIDHFGWYNRNAAINPYLVEGKKTVALEIAEQLDFKLTDWVAVSVGDGCTIGGVYKGFYDLLQLGLIKKIPRILGVQASGCAPLYKAFRTNGPVEAAEENTLADSISVGVPRNPVKALEAVKKSGGNYVSVSDESILEAMSLLGKTEGIFGEPAGVASLAGIQVAIQEGVIKKDESVTFIMTGNGLKDIKNGQLAAKEPIHMNSNVDEMIRILSQK